MGSCSPVMWHPGMAQLEEVIGSISISNDTPSGGQLVLPYKSSALSYVQAAMKMADIKVKNKRRNSIVLSVVRGSLINPVGNKFDITV